MPLQSSKKFVCQSQSYFNLAALAEQAPLNVDQASKQPELAPIVHTATQIAKPVICSPGQKQLLAYLTLKNQAGERPTRQCQLWLQLRRLSKQMITLDAANRELNKKTPRKEFVSASKSIAKYLQALCAEVSYDERKHPAFRAELRMHVANMCRWNFCDRSSWINAYDLLDFDETVTVFNETYSQSACLEQAHQATIRKHGF